MKPDRAEDAKRITADFERFWNVVRAWRDPLQRYVSRADGLY